MPKNAKRVIPVRSGAERLIVPMATKGQANSQQVSLRSMAHKIAARWLACPVQDEEETIDAIILVGSVAEGYGDAYSDLDFYIVHRGGVSREQIGALAAVAGGWAFFRWHDARDEGAEQAPSEPGWLADAPVYYGLVPCEVHHVTAAFFEQALIAARKRQEMGSPQAVVASLCKASALHGADLLARWQEEASCFPPELAEAMVRHHLKDLAPRWRLYGLAKRQGDELAFRDRERSQAAFLLGILSGLNGQYFCSGSLKRLDRLAARMLIAPRDFPARWRALMDAPPLSACVLLDALIRETFCLVADHMPQVDTAMDWRKYACDLWLCGDMKG